MSAASTAGLSVMVSCPSASAAEMAAKTVVRKIYVAILRMVAAVSINVPASFCLFEEKALFLRVKKDGHEFRQFSQYIED